MMQWSTAPAEFPASYFATGSDDAYTTELRIRSFQPSDLLPIQALFLAGMLEHRSSIPVHWHRYVLFVAVTISVIH